MLLDNLAAYKEFKRKERIEFIAYLRAQIDHLYADEKIKDEKLNEYTNSLVRELRRTSFIKLFADTLGNYMPEASQLKHFNSTEVAEKFLRANNLFLERRVEESTGGMTAAMDSVMNAAEASIEQPIKEQDGKEEEAQ